MLFLLLAVFLTLVCHGTAYNCLIEEDLGGKKEYSKMFGKVPMPQKPNLYDWVYYQSDKEAEEYYKENPFT